MLDGRDDEALLRLTRVVKRMLRLDRTLLLPTAAVYLAEAHSRADDLEQANRLADLALTAAEEQGSDHLLLQALADVPAVAVRELAVYDALVGPEVGPD